MNLLMLVLVIGLFGSLCCFLGDSFLVFMLLVEVNFFFLLNSHKSLMDIYVNVLLGITSCEKTM